MTGGGGLDALQIGLHVLALIFVAFWLGLRIIHIVALIYG
jgi:hypothetical protein